MVDWDTLVMKILPGIENENDKENIQCECRYGIYAPPPLSNLG